MSKLPLPMAIATALAFTLLAGTAHARGGGHGGGIAHPAPAASVVSAGQSTSMRQPKHATFQGSGRLDAAGDIVRR